MPSRLISLGRQARHLLAVVGHSAVVRLDEAVQQIEDARLAGAVLCPITPNTTPSGTTKLTSCTALSPRKDLLSPLTHEELRIPGRGETACAAGIGAGTVDGSEARQPRARVASEARLPAPGDNRGRARTSTDLPGRSAIARISAQP